MYDWKKSLLKVIKMLIIYGIPMILNAYFLHHPQYENLTVSAAVHLLYDYLKRSLLVYLP